MELTGAPKTQIDVSDQSLIIDTPQSGIICVQAITQRGKPGVPQFVGNSTQYRRKFGGYHATSKDPVLCMRMLDAGAKLWVSRVFHYTTLTDLTTAAGTKATGTLTEVVSTVTHTVIFTAEAAGPGYNGSTIIIRTAESLDTSKADLIIKLADSDIDVTIKDVKKAMTSDELVELNKKLVGVQLTTLTVEMPLGTITLSGGVQDITAIVDNDYIGNSAAKNGWYAFGKVTDAFRIANISRPVPAVDLALAAYVNSRKDMRFHIATPLTANADGMEDYRMGTGSYSHSPIDNYLGSLIAGAININDPLDSKKQYDIPAIVDVLPLMVKKDQAKGPWYSAGGTTRGKISMPNNGLYYNLGDPDNSADWDRISKFGINPVIDDATYGPTFWGNRSLLLNTSSLLSKENIADLVVFITRNLLPLVKVANFEPNDPQSWRKVYRNVKPFIEDTLESGRAIQPGEGKNWFWQGDQNADRAEDATFNTLNDVNAGKYRARFIFIPIAAIEQIGIDVTVSDSNSLSFNLAQL